MKKNIILLLIYFILIGKISASEQINVKLEKCVDGDTADFIINDEIIKVRFLAIDAPEFRTENNEVDPNGEKASKYTCDKLTSARKIQLEFDQNSDKKDKYGRTLAWIIVDNKLLQEELVEKGLAKVAYLYGDYEYVDHLREKEKIAQNKQIGIWSNTKSDSDFLTVEQILSLLFCIGMIVISIIISVLKK